MGDNNGHTMSLPARPEGANGRASQPALIKRTISTIPPPPLPLVQPHVPLAVKPIRKIDEDDCVTKRLHIDVFKPVPDASGGAAHASHSSVDAIRIEHESSGLGTFETDELDEDAVTKEIRIERLADLTGRKTGNPTAMKVRTLPTDDTLHRSALFPGIAPGDRRGGPLRNRLRSAVPAFLSLMERALDVLAPRTQPPPKPRPRSRVPVPRPSRPPASVPPKAEKPRLRLSVNSYSRDLYQEIRSALKPGAGPALPTTLDEKYEITEAEPPRISVRALLLRRAETFSLCIRGRAVHPVAIRDIMVFADKKKVLYLSNAARDDAGYMEFSADVPLESPVRTILVVARHDDQVMGSQSLKIEKVN